MNKIDELLKIKELLDSGIISEKEFKELKNNLIQLDNNEKSTSEIIPNNITKCSNCNSIINDNETICENCNVIDSKITSSDSLSENIIPISNSKIKYIFFGIIILCLVIGLNGYYNNSNKNIEEPPPVEVSASSTSTSIPNETIATEIASDTMPATQKSENTEVDDNGEKIYKNWEDYKVGPKNINCNQGIHTESKWISVADFSTLNVTTFQHRFYDKSRIYDQNNNLIWEWKGESVQDTTWYLREHDVDISGNDKVKIEFYQGYSSPFCNGYLEVNFGKY